MQMLKEDDNSGSTRASKSKLVQNRLFSIGHSNLEFPRFVQLLQLAGVSAVVDVRSQPFSRWLPWSNRPNLEQELRDREIPYQFMGNLLGGRPSDANVYDSEGRVDYERVKRTSAFQKGLDHLSKALEDFRLVMLCSEEDPIDCHRGLLIAPAMKEHRIAASHIRSDGSLESQEQFETRLIEVTRVGVDVVDGLFAASLSAEDHSQILADAYRIQSRRKAFRLTSEQLE
jgi:uncharacterized protein (DUF488 family)